MREWSRLQYQLLLVTKRMLKTRNRIDLYINISIILVIIWRIKVTPN